MMVDKLMILPSRSIYLFTHCNFPNCNDGFGLKLEEIVNDEGKWDKKFESNTTKKLLSFFSFLRQNLFQIEISSQLGPTPPLKILIKSKTKFTDIHLTYAPFLSRVSHAPQLHLSVFENYHLFFRILRVIPLLRAKFETLYQTFDWVKNQYS